MGDASEMACLAPYELMDLPDEILVMAISWLDFESLLDAVYVNKHFRALAEPFIYESITVLHGEKALNLSHSLAKDKRRATWVRTLLISTKFGQEHALMKLPPSICSMTNLQDLRLETPDCNSKKPDDRVFWIALQDYYETIFRQSSLMVDTRSRLLPNLKSCVIHFVDTHTELYSLTRYSSIFLHPTLESLTISCMSTDRPEALFKDIPDIGLFKKSTALKHLHLEECDLHPPCLELLLSFPSALETLKISEGTRYDGIFRAGSSRMHGNVKPLDFAQAVVNTCRDSLISLSLALGHVRPRGLEISNTGQHLNFRELVNLKHLEINNRTLNLIRSRPNCDHFLWQRLPPSIETLKVFAIPLLPQQHDANQPYVPLLPCIIREKQLHGVPNLNKIAYSYEHYESTDDDDMNFNDLLMNLVYNEANGNPPHATIDDQQVVHANIHTNPLLNLLQQAVEQAQPPPPPPAIPANFVTAAMNPNLDVPPQNVHPPHFRWRNGATFTGPPARPELSRSDAAKLALLTTIQDTIIDIFHETQTTLEIDLVALPRGFIPPYLFPEDKPKVSHSWFTSTNPLTPQAFINAIRAQREALRAQMHRRLQRTGSREDEPSLSIPITERERSRSRFMQRLQREQLAAEVPTSDDGAGSTDADSLPDDMGIDLEMEDALEMLIHEAQAEAAGENFDHASVASNASSGSSGSGGSEYVDAGTEVEMSEVDYDDEDDEDSEFGYY